MKNLTKTILFASLITAMVLPFSAMDSAFAEFPTPLKQIKSGVALHDVQCNEGKVLVAISSIKVASELELFLSSENKDLIIDWDLDSEYVGNSVVYLYVKETFLDMNYQEIRTVEDSPKRLHSDDYTNGFSNGEFITVYADITIIDPELGESETFTSAPYTIQINEVLPEMQRDLPNPVITQAITDNSEITLEWELPSQDEYDTSNIIIFWHQTGLDGERQINLGSTATSYTFVGLENNTQYTFVVVSASDTEYERFIYSLPYTATPHIH